MKKYSKYKDSGIEWMGEIPEHWDRTAIKRMVITKVTDGPHTTPKFIDSGVPFISAEGVSNGKVDFNKKRGFISEETDKEYSLKCKPQRDDIFIVKSGSTTGKIAYVDFDDNFNIWSPIALVRSDKRKAFGKFIYYALASNYFQKQIQLNWSFGTQPNIGMGIIENLLVILPEVQEQKSIAQYLDQKTTIIDTLLEKTKQKITTLQEQRTAIINQAVTKGLTHLPPAKGGTKGVPLKKSGVERIGNIPENWEVKKTSYLCSEMKSGPFGSSLKKSSYTKTGYKIYGQEQVIKDDFSYGDYFIGEEKFNELRRCEIFAGDILISCVGTFGKIAMVPNEFQKGIINPRLLKLTPNNLILSRYFLLVLRSSLTFSQLTALSRGGTMGVINLDILRQLKFPIPSLKEQEEIYNYVNQKTKEVETLIQKEQQRINLLKEYRQSLISEVVTGKRCVHNEIPVT